MARQRIRCAPGTSPHALHLQKQHKGINKLFLHNLDGKQGLLRFGAPLFCSCALQASCRAPALCGRAHPPCAPAMRGLLAVTQSAAVTKHEANGASSCREVLVTLQPRSPLRLPAPRELGKERCVSVLFSGHVHRSTGKATQPLRLLCFIKPGLSVDSSFRFAAAKSCCHPVEFCCNLTRKQSWARYRRK